jgi:hypothetical protein
VSASAAPAAATPPAGAPPAGAPRAAGPASAPPPATVIAAGRSPATGRAGGGAELRRGVGQPPAQLQWLDDLTALLGGDGFVLLAGEIAVLTTDNGHYDIRPERPGLVVTGDLPVRVVALDTTGGPLLDQVISTAAATVVLPPHTERAVALGGAGPPAGAVGWHAGTKLAKAGPRTLIGPGCVITSSAVASRRAGTPVGTAFVAGADAVAGYAVVTTQLPRATNAVALILENAPRVDDDRGDALDLGLAGATRAAGPAGTPEPAQIIVSGARTIAVYAIVPDQPVPGAAPVPVAVTVASGEHLHLSGVVGGTAGAAALASALRRGDICTVLAPLCGVADGTATLRWVAQPGPDGPQHSQEA